MFASAAAAPTRSRLNPAQVEHFHREGYVLPGVPVFAPEKFAALKAYFETLLAELPEGKRPEGMDVPHFSYPRLFEWLFDDAVLDLVEPILGPDIALWSSHFICKPGSDGKRVPWHEDSAYWGDRLAPMEVVTVWLAIDASDADNGCMRVIPRALHGYSDYVPVDDPANHVFGTEIKKYDAKRAVDIVLDPNHCSLHESRLMHGSNANRSGRRRCGYTMRYISASTKFIVEQNSHHQIYLARGQDRAGNDYGDPGRDYSAMRAARAGTIKSGH